MLATQTALGLADLTAAAPALVDPSLRFEVARMAAEAAFEAGCYATAAARFAGLAAHDDLALSRGERVGLSTWSRRARFFAARERPLPAACADIDTASMALDDAAGPRE